jgi:hypothetical protein
MIEKSAWGCAPRLLRASPNTVTKGVEMAEVSSGERGHDENYPAHAHGYEGFLTLLKWSMVVVAIVAAVVIFIIAN